MWLAGTPAVAASQGPQRFGEGTVVPLRYGGEHRSSCVKHAALVIFSFYLLHGKTSLMPDLGLFRFAAVKEIIRNPVVNLLSTMLMDCVSQEFC